MAGARSSRGPRQNDIHLLHRNLSIFPYALRNTERARDIPASSRRHPERGPMADVPDLSRRRYRVLEGRKDALTTCGRSPSTATTNRCNVETLKMLVLTAENRLPQSLHHTRQALYSRRQLEGLCETRIYPDRRIPDSSRHRPSPPENRPPVHDRHRRLRVPTRRDATSIGRQRQTE